MFQQYLFFLIINLCFIKYLYIFIGELFTQSEFVVVVRENANLFDLIKKI